WLLPWWRAFVPGELNVLVIRAGDRLVALAPFYLETGPRGRRVLPIGIPVTDYHDVLIDPEITDSAAAALSRQMTETATWHEWEFPELAPAAEALRVPVPASCIERLEPTSACPVLVLPNGIGHPEAVYPTRK